MNGDPLDSLQAFYEECRAAEVPNGLVARPRPAPWWLRLEVPLGGLAAGAAAATALVMSPAEPSPEVGARAARALAQIRRETPMPPPPPRAKTGGGRRDRWNA